MNVFCTKSQQVAISKQIDGRHSLILTSQLWVTKKKIKKDSCDNWPLNESIGQYNNLETARVDFERKLNIIKILQLRIKVAISYAPFKVI